MAGFNNLTSFKQTQMKFFKKPASDPSIAITKITNASPPVITTADDTLQSGDVIYINSDNSAAEGLFMVKSNGSGSYEIVGADFTDVGAISNAKFGKADTHAYCMATQLDVDFGKVSYQDVMTNCDAYPREEGEVEAGSYSGSAYSNSQNPVEKLIEDALFSQEKLFFVWKKKEETIIRGSRITVESFKISGKTKERWTADFGFKMQSRPVRLEV